MKPELWVTNLLRVARQIADEEYQERRWLARDRDLWERPEELINMLMDDYVLDEFIETYSPTFSTRQRTAALEFKDEVNSYCRATQQRLEPAEVLSDPRWKTIRESAAKFVNAFNGEWPAHSKAGDSK